MRNRSIVLTSCAIIAVGSAYLSTPPPASASDAGPCTKEQWQDGEDAANAYCAGASYSISCNGNTVVVTILACPAGNG